MKNIVIFILGVFCVIMGVTRAQGEFTGSGNIHDYALAKGAYQGSEIRNYKVYVPDSYDGGRPVPMVFALHGCNMDHIDVLNDWNWDIAADDHSFILVLPFVSGYGISEGFRANNCWGYFFDLHIHQGKGEVEDLHRMALEVESLYNIDPERRYIVGLSSGGGMAVASAIAFNEYWAAAASVEGLPYGDWADSVTADRFKSLSSYVNAIRNELDNQRAIPFMVIQSLNDTVVLKTAAELIRDSHLDVFGVDNTNSSDEDCTAEGIPCTLTRYMNPSGKSIIETVLYDGDVDGAKCGFYGCGHYYVGEDTNYDAWAYAKGPHSTDILWNFFSMNTLHDNKRPRITITCTAAGSSLRVEGEASDDDGHVTDVNIIIKKYAHPNYNLFSETPVTGNFASFTMDIEGMPAGIYKVHAQAIDNDIGQSISPYKIICVNMDCHEPYVEIENVKVVDNQVSVSGKVLDEDLNSVKLSTQTHGNASGTVMADFLPMEEGSYTFEGMIRNLDQGTHTLVVTATDITEMTGTDTEEVNVECAIPPSARGSIQTHCEQGRLSWSGYSHYYLKYYNDPFTVYQWPDGSWSDAKPGCGSTNSATCVHATLSRHVDEGRAYMERIWYYFWTMEEYFAKGSDNPLGYYSLSEASLKETEPGYWVKVEFCPDE